MTVHANWSALGETRWYEYALRFLLGGMVTALAGLIAHLFGPGAGGLFLAFPAIFCASATLVAKHERQRKKRLGLSGLHRGTDAAALLAAGSGWGSIGLAGFGLTVWLLAPALAYGSLIVACVVWFAVSVLLWRFVSHRA
jgi:Protein of unknown function (DUF3147)